MNVMVTGATGFVGGHLVERLLERGDHVTALVRSPRRAAPLAARGVQLVLGDLADTAAIGRATADQDVVYHVAAMLGAATEAQLMTANRDGTLNIARAAAAEAPSPRVVLMSSMAAGGPARRGVPRVVDGNDNPVTMYGRSKVAAERVLPTLALPWTALRAPVVYGPGDREAMLPMFKAVRLGLAPMFGDGSMELSLIYIHDLVDAMIEAAVAPDVVGEVFNVCHPEVTTAANVMRAIAREMGRAPIPISIPSWTARVALRVTGAWADLTKRPSILHPDKVHEFYQEAWTGDPEPFMRATGWQPQWDLAHGLADTADWYRRERLI